jgi:hypothetical protein
MENKEKVYPIGLGAQSRQDEAVAEEIRAATGRDMGRVALLVSLLAVLMLTVFFFSVNRSISGLGDQLKDLAGLRQQVAGVEQKVAGLERLPEATKRLVLAGMLQETMQRLAFMQGQTQNPDAAAKLAQAQELLSQAGVELSK